MVGAKSRIGLSTRSHAEHEWPEISRQTSFLLPYQFRDLSFLEQFFVPTAPCAQPVLSSQS